MDYWCIALKTVQVMQMYFEISAIVWKIINGCVFCLTAIYIYEIPILAKYGSVLKMFFYNFLMESI